MGKKSLTMQQSLSTDGNYSKKADFVNYFQNYLNSPTKPHKLTRTKRASYSTKKDDDDVKNAFMTGSVLASMFQNVTGGLGD